MLYLKGKKLFRPSVILLIIANIVPLLVVLFLNWDLFQILFLYWLGSAVIGFYNMLKLIKVGGAISILLVPFFVLHYGSFMAAHDVHAHVKEHTSLQEQL